MDVLHAVVLGLVQGVTEFLPISSSAHLVLLPALAGWADQGLLYDVGAHFGSLLALLWYFRKDLARMGAGWVSSFRAGRNHDADMLWLLAVATVPICLAGLLAHGLLDPLRDALVIAAATALFALLLWWADAHGRRHRDLDDVRLRDAVIIGLFQVLAIIPGTSRAGITITAGLLLGLRREAASRFSLLLAIPTILVAAGAELLNAARAPAAVDWPALFIVSATAFLSACLTIHWFLQLVERTGMLPYVLYRLALGGLLFVLFA